MARPPDCKASEWSEPRDGTAGASTSGSGSARADGRRERGVPAFDGFAPARDEDRREPPAAVGSSPSTARASDSAAAGRDRDRRGPPAAAGSARVAAEAFDRAAGVDAAASGLAGFDVERVGAARFRAGTATPTSFAAGAGGRLDAAADWVGGLRAADPVPRADACAGERSGPAGGVLAARRVLSAALADFSWAAVVVPIGRDFVVGDVAEEEEPRRRVGIRRGSALCGAVECDEPRAPTGMVAEGAAEAVAARRDPPRGDLALVLSCLLGADSTAPAPSDLARAA